MEDKLGVGDELIDQPRVANVAPNELKVRILERTREVLHRSRDHVVEPDDAPGASFQDLVDEVTPDEASGSRHEDGLVFVGGEVGGHGGRRLLQTAGTVGRFGPSECPCPRKPARVPLLKGATARREAHSSMLTALLHTRNRPAFVGRALRYYKGKLRHPLLVVDASDGERFAQLEAVVAGADLDFPIQLLHQPPDTPLPRRLREALEIVETPFVLPMADDDFYFESWLAEGVAYLAANPSVGVAFGHTIHFDLPTYVPYGPIERFHFSVPNPVARWMGQASPVERLRELGKGPFATTGWYAMQRAEILKAVVSTAERERFSLDMLERLLNVMQPIHGKVVLVDAPDLARQTNPVESEFHRPSSFATNERFLARLQTLAAEALEETAALSRADASRVVEATLLAEIAQLKANDRRRLLKIDLFKKAFPRAIRVARSLRRVFRPSAAPCLTPDQRFPAVPSFGAIDGALEPLRAACREPVMSS